METVQVLAIYQDLLVQVKVTIQEPDQVTNQVTVVVTNQAPEMVIRRVTEMVIVIRQETALQNLLVTYKNLAMH